jgi:hypothetical protein
VTPPRDKRISRRLVRIFWTASNVFGYYRDPLFLFCLCAYLVNRELIKPHLHSYSPLFDGHFDDCLLVPVALPIFLLVYRRLGLRPDDAAPRWWEIGWHLLVWSLFFKWFGPVVLHRSVADPYDVLCYAGGGLAAWAIWNFWPGETGGKQRGDDILVMRGELPSLRADR